MAAPLLQRRYTPAEYLAYEREAETKHEYIAGQILAMSGGSRAHARISMNLAQALGPLLRDRPCATYGSDLRVKVPARGMYTYPDVSVVCGEEQFDDAQADTLLNPTLIVEVLSRSTEAYDRGVKFEYYRTIPSLQEYLLISQDRILVEHFARAGDTWVLTTISDLNAVVRLPAIGCTLALAEIYRKVLLPVQPKTTDSSPADPSAADDTRA